MGLLSTGMDGPALVLLGSPCPEKRAGGMPKGPAARFVFPSSLLPESPGRLAETLHVRYVVGERVFQGVGAAASRGPQKEEEGLLSLEKAAGVEEGKWILSASIISVLKKPSDQMQEYSTK